MLTVTDHGLGDAAQGRPIAADRKGRGGGALAELEQRRLAVGAGPSIAKT